MTREANTARRLPEFGGVDVMAVRYARHRFAHHAHEGFAFGIVETGGVRLPTERGVLLAGRGAITVLHPGEAHAGEAAADGLSYRSLQIGDVALKTALEDHALWRRTGTPTFPVQVIENIALTGAMLRFHRTLSTSPDPLERSEALVATIGRLLVRHAGFHGPPRSESGPCRGVARARDYIDAHFAERVTLADIATASGLGERHLLRQFTRTFGLPPYGYLVGRRVECVKRALARGHPAAEAAIDAGFADQSHMSRHFKRVVGVTPMRYLAS